jgi:hypothetical protein
VVGVGEIGFRVDNGIAIVIATDTVIDNNHNAKRVDCQQIDDQERVSYRLQRNGRIEFLVCA